MKFKTILQNMDIHELNNFLVENNINYTKSILESIAQVVGGDSSNEFKNKIISLLDDEKVRAIHSATMYDLLNREYTFVVNQEK